MEIRVSGWLDIAIVYIRILVFLLLRSSFVAPKLAGILVLDDFQFVRAHVSLPGAMAVWNRLVGTCATGSDWYPKSQPFEPFRISLFLSRRD